MAIATIWDVARLADVSIKTVSRVINDEPNVRVKTRKRVQIAIDELDYHPHPGARGLAAKRTFTIGLLLENPESYGYIQRLIDGAFDTCLTRRFMLLVQPIGNQLDADSIRKYVRQTRVDGIVLPPPLCDQSVVTSTLSELDVPYASLSPKEVNGSCIAVRPNDEEATREVVRQVYSRGHRRIGFIRGIQDHGASVRRLSGFQQEMEEFGLDRGEGLIVDGHFDFESGLKGAKQLLELSDPPTAIIASNDDMANGAMIAAHRRHLSIPKDLSVVGFDDSAIAHQTYPALTTMRQPIYEMAQDATKRLIDQATGQPNQTVSRVYDCTFVLRDSLAPLGEDIAS